MLKNKFVQTHGQTLRQIFEDKEDSSTTDTIRRDVHICKAISKEKFTIGWLHHNLINWDPTVMVAVYMAFIWPHLEYETNDWSMSACTVYWKIIIDLKGFQRIFTRLVHGLGKLL